MGMQRVRPTMHRLSVERDSMLRLGRVGAPLSWICAVLALWFAACSSSPAELASQGSPDVGQSRTSSDREVDDALRGESSLQEEAGTSRQAEQEAELRGPSETSEAPNEDDRFGEMHDRCAEEAQEGPWEEYSERFERCIERSTGEPEGFASDARIEEVSWEAALRWWPYRPVLDGESAIRPGAAERLFVSSETGGRDGDPRSELSGITLVYEYPDASADDVDLQGVVDGGGLVVGVNFYPPEGPSPSAGDLNSKPVIVRDHPAHMTEIRRDGEDAPAEGRYQGNVDLRTVFWARPLDSGGTLRWHVANSPEEYSEQETLEWIDGLREVD